MTEALDRLGVGGDLGRFLKRELGRTAVSSRTDTEQAAGAMTAREPAQSDRLLRAGTLARASDPATGRRRASVSSCDPRWLRDRRREPLAVGLRRVTVDQFDIALRSMAQDPMDLAVHEVRKATKRVRALLRLVRTQLGDERYRPRTPFCATRPDCSPRCAMPMCRSPRSRLSGTGSDHSCGRRRLPTLSDRLADRRRRVFERTVDEDDWTRVVYSCVLLAPGTPRGRWRRHRSRPRNVSDRHGFDSVGPGLAMTYRRGRQEMAEAASSAHRGQLPRVAKAGKVPAPPVGDARPAVPGGARRVRGCARPTGGGARRRARSRRALRFLAAHPAYAPDPTERSMLVALVQHRRAELQTAALSLGSRVYAETPNRFTPPDGRLLVGVGRADPGRIRPSGRRRPPASVPRREGASLERDEDHDGSTASTSPGCPSASPRRRSSSIPTPTRRPPGPR
jgi:hypothetical protein